MTYHKQIIIASCAGVVLLSTGIGGIYASSEGSEAGPNSGRSEQPGMAPVVYAPTAPPGHSTSSNVTPASELAAIIESYGGNAIVDATIGGPPEGFEPTDGTVPTPSSFKDGKWVYLLVDAPSDTWAAIRPIWEADLVTGVLRDQLHAMGDVLYAGRTSLRLSDGSTVPDVSGPGNNIAFNQAFPTPDMTSIGPALQDALGAAGLKMTSLEILTPNQPAPAVVATTLDPVRFIRDASRIIDAAFGNPPTYEGYYFEVRDMSGKPVFVQAADFRVGAGHRYVRPDLNQGNSFLGNSASSQADRGSPQP